MNTRLTPFPFTNPTPSWNLYSSDHLGSVRVGVDGTTGSVVETYRYWPFGDNWCTSYPCTPLIQERVGFAAMERDTESNHYYDHARAHDFNDLPPEKWSSANDTLLVTQPAL